MERRSLSLWFAGLSWLVAVCGLVVLTARAFGRPLPEVLPLGDFLVAEGQAEVAASVVILGVFSMVAGTLAFEAARIAREAQALAVFPPSIARSSVPACDRLLRAGWRLRLLAPLPALEALRDALPALSALDRSALEQNYRTLKAMVWTLPVLGFVGTAWGMVAAIGGFRRALGIASTLSEAAQVQRLTEDLAREVIPGLTGVFSVTVLALVATVLAHFWVTAVEGWERRVLQRLDEQCLERLLAALATDPGRGATPAERQVADLGEELRGLNARLAAASETDAAGSLTAAAAQIAAAAAAMRDAATAPYRVTIHRGEGI